MFTRLELLCLIVMGLIAAAHAILHIYDAMRHDECQEFSGFMTFTDRRVQKTARVLLLVYCILTVVLVVHSGIYEYLGWFFATLVILFCGMYWAFILLCVCFIFIVFSLCYKWLRRWLS